MKNKSISIFLVYVRKCLEPRARFAWAPKGPMICEKPDLDLTSEAPEMPTLQRMHELTTSHPMCTAKFFLLMEELNFRHLQGIDSMYLGNFRLHRSLGHFNIEDDFASSGVPGLSGFALAVLEALEAQGRGFEHGHRKTVAVPGPQFLDWPKHLGEDDNKLETFLRSQNSSLCQKAVTLQYENANLPGQQLSVSLSPEPFSIQQQKQTKFDGLLEADQITKRPLVEVVPEEHLRHIATEMSGDHATLPRNPYREIPLTTAELSSCPHYRLPPFMHMVTHSHNVYEGVAKYTLESNDAGEVQHIVDEHGLQVSCDALCLEAQQWHHAFAADFRFLHCHCHDHRCSFTCLKNIKKTMAEKRKLLKSNRAPACRFSFFHIAAFAGKRVRRRGKRPQSETFIGTSEDPNEHGLVHVPRAHPFRSATSDVTMVSCRCNCDFKFVVRGYPSANQEDNAPIFKCENSLLPTLLNVPRKLLETRMSETIRRCAYNIVAMHVASFNTDFYITKYATKPMEHLQNAVSCLALGLKRLEVEEETGQQPFEEKCRAKRVTLRLAAASNRCAWVSTTELASTLLTEGHCWTSHNEIPLFLARTWFLINEAKRILQGSRGHTVEPASVPMDFVEIEMEDVGPVADCDPDADDAPPVDADDVPQSAAADDGSNDKNFPVDGQRSHSGTDDEDPEDENEPGTGVWKTATLKTTSSLHDDWLHRGPFLQSLSWFVYASRVRRVPKPKTLQKNMLHFPFDSHYPPVS